MEAFSEFSPEAPVWVRQLDPRRYVVKSHRHDPICHRVRDSLRERIVTRHLKPSVVHSTTATATTAADHQSSPHPLTDHNSPSQHTINPKRHNKRRCSTLTSTRMAENGVVGTAVTASTRRRNSTPHSQSHTGSISPSSANHLTPNQKTSKQQQQQQHSKTKDIERTIQRIKKRARKRELRSFRESQRKKKPKRKKSKQKAPNQNGKPHHQLRISLSSLGNNTDDDTPLNVHSEGHLHSSLPNYHSPALNHQDAALTPHSQTDSLAPFSPHIEQSRIYSPFAYHSDSSDYPMRRTFGMEKAASSADKTSKSATLHSNGRDSQASSRMHSPSIDEMANSPMMRKRLFNHRISPKVQKQWRKQKRKGGGTAHVRKAPDAEDIYHLLLHKSEEPFSQSDDDTTTDDSQSTTIEPRQLFTTDFPREESFTASSKRRHTSTFTSIEKGFSPHISERPLSAKRFSSPVSSRRIPSSFQLFRRSSMTRPQSASSGSIGKRRSSTSSYSSSRAGSALLRDGAREDGSPQISQLCVHLQATVRLPTPVEEMKPLS